MTADEDRTPSNVSDQFERLPATPAERRISGRPTRESVVGYWEERFAIPPETFEGITFWEKGAGKIWAVSHELDSPVRIEALGMPVLRTRQEFWKPTTDAAQRFGTLASRNVISLGREEAETFTAGQDQTVSWDRDWGYLIAAHEIAGGIAPIGVGLFTYGELKSMVPKGRRREF